MESLNKLYSHTFKYVKPKGLYMHHATFNVLHRRYYVITCDDTNGKSSAIGKTVYLHANYLNVLQGARKHYQTYSIEAINKNF